MIGEFFTILLALGAFISLIVCFACDEIGAFFLALAVSFFALFVPYQATKDNIQLKPLEGLDNYSVTPIPLKQEAIITVKNPHNGEVLEYTLKDKEYFLLNQLESVTLTYGTSSHFWITFEEYGLQVGFRPPQQ